METINTSSNKITIIGLGSMGSTIASLYLQHKYEVTVWNRNAEKAKQLVQDGAILAQDIVEAVKASPVVIICVYDYQATHEIFLHDEIASALTGKTVIQLTTGSPKDATDSESWFNEYGAEYLDGAIQVAPEQMAQPDTTILLSGSTAIYAQNKTLLEILGGNITYLGNSISSAAAMDLATLSYVYGSIFGFLHGVLIAETNQLDVNIFSAIVSKMAPSLGQFLQHEGNVIQKDDFTISQSPLAISIEAIDRILTSAQQAKINTSFPEFASALLAKAQNEGYANQELASLIKVLRQKETHGSLETT